MYMSPISLCHLIFKNSIYVLDNACPWILLGVPML